MGLHFRVLARGFAHASGVLLALGFMAGVAAADEGAPANVPSVSEQFRRVGSLIEDPRVREGHALFERIWQPAGEGMPDSDGLGPVYNARSCAACHPAAGRGAPPRRQGDATRALLIRLSLERADGSVGPHPDYGAQVNTSAVAGVPPEATVFLAWEPVDGAYGDGTPWRLRRPVLLFKDLAHGPADEAVLRSARVPPHLPGLGLLEAVAEAEILSRADPADADGDGISGRPNRMIDDTNGREVIGRFGWKAGQPSLRRQVATALIEDMGLTSALFPEENCPPVQAACLAAPSGGVPEVDGAALAALVAYSAALMPPERRAGPTRDERATIRRGELLFHASGCAACHTPALPLPGGGKAAAYTDLLLHDLGDALADNRPEADASGREWRTPPLWGLGLVQRVNGHSLFLHDGRARGFAEAVLWHGGEAEPAREAFRMMTAADRAALVAFLESL